MNHLNLIVKSLAAFTLCICGACGAQELIVAKPSPKSDDANPVANGTVFACGGALEMDAKSPDFFKELAPALIEASKQSHQGRRPKLAAIMSGSSSSIVAKNAWNTVPDEKGYGDLFKELGFDATMIPINADNYNGPSYVAGAPAAVADDAKWAAIVRDADIVFLNGGDQALHFRALTRQDGTDSELLKAIRFVLSKGGATIGTSAGSHVSSSLMFGNGTSYAYITKNEVFRATDAEQLAAPEWDKDPKNLDDNLKIGADGYLVDKVTGARVILKPTLGHPTRAKEDLGSFGKGLGLWNGVMLDSHSAARGRIGRMIVALAKARSTEEYKNIHLAIGPDENTCVGWHAQSRTASVIGQHGIWIADLSEAKIASTKNGSFSGKNVSLSFLMSGDSFTVLPNGRLGTITSKRPLSTNTPTGSAKFGGNILGKDQLSAAIRIVVAQSLSQLKGQVTPPEGEKGPIHSFNLTVSGLSKTFAAPRQKNDDPTKAAVSVERMTLDIN